MLTHLARNSTLYGNLFWFTTGSDNFTLQITSQPCLEEGVISSRSIWKQMLHSNASLNFSTTRPLKREAVPQRTWLWSYLMLQKITATG